MMRKSVYLILPILILFSACDPESLETAGADYAIGDTGPGGGIVFYDDEEGFDFNADGIIGADEKGLFNGKAEMNDKRYLESAVIGWNGSSEDSTAIWGDYGTDISAVVNLEVYSDEVLNVLSSMTGYGLSNTLNIIDNMESKSISGTAAQICGAYNGGDCNDWFLPSVGEMYILYIRQYTAGGGFSQNEYWTSSEHSTTLVWYVFMRTGTMNTSKKGVSTYYIRPVRAF